MTAPSCCVHSSAVVTSTCIVDNTAYAYSNNVVEATPCKRFWDDIRIRDAGKGHLPQAPTPHNRSGKEIRIRETENLGIDPVDQSQQRIQRSGGIISLIPTPKGSSSFIFAVPRNCTGSCRRKSVS